MPPVLLSSTRIKRGNPRDYSVFKEKRHDAKIIRRQAKQEYDQRLFDKLNTPNIYAKDYWKTAKTR
jgi:hypothetical protein